MEPVALPDSNDMLADVTIVVAILSWLEGDFLNALRRFHVDGDKVW